MYYCKASSQHSNGLIHQQEILKRKALDENEENVVILHNKDVDRSKLESVDALPGAVTYESLLTDHLCILGEAVFAVGQRQAIRRP